MAKYTICYIIALFYAIAEHMAFYVGHLYTGCILAVCGLIYLGRGIHDYHETHKD